MLFVWKNTFFFYNPGMSKFKTRKLIIPKREPPIKDTGKITEEGSQEEKKASPRKPFWTKKIWIISILILLTGVFAMQAYSLFFKRNTKFWSENYTPPSIIEAFVNEKVEWTTNILIAGIGGKWHDGSDLTDSIMLASLDGKTKKVTLLSIPRDLYVSYGKWEWAGRINTLYDLWKRDTVGIKYLVEKVTEITGQQIDHHIVIDFSGFKQIIDILGWVSVDVPEDLLDREYPDNNWGYTVFSVKKWPQNFDGDTALKYARSRHSTSDFDRSNRQQLILKAIKEKASELGYITNPEKISDLYGAVISHLDTDFSLAGMAEIALWFHDVKSEDISIVSLSDTCFSLTKCVPGSYLYPPDRERFGWQAVIIPENASATKLSYYDDIRRFVDVTFHFPSLRKESRDMVIVSDPTMKKRAQEIGYGLAKLWFPFSFEKTLTTSTGTIEKSHINIYWHPDISVGIDPSVPRVMALKYIEESIPYTLVERNEYITNFWPRIEIVIGKDAMDYFTFLKNPYYLPIVPKPTLSWESPPSVSWEPKILSHSRKSPPTIKKSAPPSEQAPTLTTSISTGEWENF